MATADHYSLLGVDRDATTAAIKKAYLALARRHHPDTGGEHALMTWVNLAWATLRDARTRHSYDLTLPGRRSRSSRLHHQTVEKVVRRAAAGLSVQPQTPASPSQWIPEDRSDWYELLGVWSQANRQQMREVLEQALQSKSAEEWEVLFNAAGVPCGRILTVAEIARHPHLESRQFVKHFKDVPGVGRDIAVPRLGFRLASGQPDVHTPPPQLGRDTAALLGGVGYSASEIDELRGQGVI